MNKGMVLGLLGGGLAIFLVVFATSDLSLQLDARNKAKISEMGVCRNAIGGTPEGLEYLLKLGRNPDEVDPYYGTALKALVELSDDRDKDKRQMMEALVRYGANINQISGSGRSLVDEAKILGKTNFVQILETK